MNNKRNIKLTRNRQSGNMGGYIIAILFFGGLLTIAGKLGPLYLDHNTMAKQMDKMAEQPGLSQKRDRVLRGMLRTRFKLNNIREFDMNEHIKFVRTGSGTDIVMAYEVRMPVIHNVDLIATFDKEVKLRD